ncbi:MAG: hypothetical protein AAB296_05085, partial [Candidatus Desantisbacteria bacterium]
GIRFESGASRTTIQVISQQDSLILPVSLGELPGSYTICVEFTDTGGGKAQGQIVVAVVPKKIRKYQVSAGFTSVRGATSSNEAGARSQVKLLISNNDIQPVSRIEIISPQGFEFDTCVGAGYNGFKVIEVSTGGIKLNGRLIAPGETCELHIPVINPQVIDNYSIRLKLQESSSCLEFDALPVTLPIIAVYPRAYGIKAGFVEGYCQENSAQSRILVYIKNNNPNTWNRIESIKLSGYGFTNNIYDDVGNGFRVKARGDNWIVLSGGGIEHDAAFSLSGLNSEAINISGSVTEATGLGFNLPLTSLYVKPINQGLRQVSISVDMMGNEVALAADLLPLANEAGAASRLRFNLENLASAPYLALKTILINLPAGFEIINPPGSKLENVFILSDKGEAA